MCFIEQVTCDHREESYEGPNVGAHLPCFQHQQGQSGWGGVNRQRVEDGPRSHRFSEGPCKPLQVFQLSL